MKNDIIDQIKRQEVYKEKREKYLQEDAWKVPKF